MTASNLKFTNLSEPTIDRENPNPMTTKIVIHVDDEASWRSKVKRAFVYCGWNDQQIRSFDSSEQAIESFENEKLSLDNVSMVVLDSKGVKFFEFLSKKDSIKAKELCLGFSSGYNTLENVGVEIVLPKNGYAHLPSFIPDSVAK
jgi:hypothetical protein